MQTMRDNSVLETSENIDAARQAELEQNCLKCIHFKVCKIIEASASTGVFSPRGSQDKPIPPPIDLMEFAKICKAYIREAGVITQ